MSLRYIDTLQGCPPICIVPLPSYSSDMSRSYSSLLRSMPIYQPQLKRTAFRLLSPAAGVYGGAALPLPCPPLPCPPFACAGAGACALAVDSTPMVKTMAIVTCVYIIFRRKVIIVPPGVLGCRLIVGVTGGNLDHVPVRIGHRLEKAQRTAVLCRDEPRLDGIPGVKGIRSGFADPPLR